MGSGLLVILIVGGAAAGFALLSVLGSERQRMLGELEARRQRPQPAASEPPAAAPPQASPPAAAKPPRRNAR